MKDAPSTGDGMGRNMESASHGYADSYGGSDFQGTQGDYDSYDGYDAVRYAQSYDDYAKPVPATGSSQIPSDGEQQAYRGVTKDRKKLYKRASIVFIGIFIVSGTLLALMMGTNWLRNKAYVDLSSDIDIEMRDQTTSTQGLEKVEPASGRDWTALLNENGDLKYWMTVENKPIDYPLVQHPTDQNYYLKHNFWGGSDIAGTPFIDVRNYLSDKHLLTYGHHITGSDTMYSTVNKAWDPDEFAEIGKLTLEAPTENGTSYEIFYPAFALMVDQSYQDIQTFEFDSDAQFRQWLHDMAETASAKNEYTDYLCRNARRSVSFVTCASDTPNQRERTIIMFVAVAPPSTSYDDANFLPQDIAEVTAQQQAKQAEQQTQQQMQQQQQSQQVGQQQQAQQAGQQIVQQQTGNAQAGRMPAGHQQVATKLNLVGLLSQGTKGVSALEAPSSPLLDGSSQR